MTDYSEAIHPESGDSGLPQEGYFPSGGDKIRVSGIFNGTENGTLNVRGGGLLILPALFVLTDFRMFCLR